jgi:hypothetical protein
VDTCPLWQARQASRFRQQEQALQGQGRQQVQQ